MGFKPRKSLRGHDLLRTLPPEELAKVPALTTEQIEEALKRGAESARELDKQLAQAFRPPRGWRTLRIY